MNPLGRYSLGTKNKNLKTTDGSLTLYVSAKSPGKGQSVAERPKPVVGGLDLAAVKPTLIEAINLDWRAQ